MAYHLWTMGLIIIHGAHQQQHATQHRWIQIILDICPQHNTACHALHACIMIPCMHLRRCRWVAYAAGQASVTARPSLHETVVQLHASLVAAVHASSMRSLAALLYCC